jgi:hypothetical protein
MLHDVRAKAQEWQAAGANIEITWHSRGHRHWRIRFWEVARRVVMMLWVVLIASLTAAAIIYWLIKHHKV